MFDRLYRAHRRAVVALGVAVAALAAWTAVLGLGVVQLAEGRPALLACVAAATMLFNRPLDVAFRLLGVSIRFEERGARLRAIRVRRARLVRAA